MSLFIVLLLAGVVSWVLRVAFIGVIPADRLPERVRDALDHLPPAVLAAIVASELVHAATVEAGRGAGAVLSPLVAAAVTGVAAWRSRNLAVTTGVGLAAMGLLSLALP